MDLSYLITKIVNINNKIEDFDSIFNQEQKVHKLIQKSNDLNELISEKKDLSILISKILTAKNKINEKNKIFMKYKKELKKIMPDVCPLCGAKT